MNDEQRKQEPQASPPPESPQTEESAESWEAKKAKNWKRQAYFPVEERAGKKWAARNILASFGFAIDGILYAVLYERNMRFDVIVSALVLLASLFFNFSRNEFAILALTITFVLMSEMINTAVEALCDLLVGERYDRHVKMAKDVAAGATLLAAINAMVVGYLLFFDKVKLWTNAVYERIRVNPSHAAFIAVGLVLIIVVLAKALWYRGHGTPLHGGSVSGHTALAFCLATIAAFLVDSAAVAVLSYLLALLVAESRYEGRVHTLGEVVLGALVGLAVAGAIFFWVTRS